jgi:tRNA (guanine37-N1)-methyltransferase
LKKTENCGIIITVFGFQNIIRVIRIHSRDICIMIINFLTIFPGMFDSYLNESILKRAQAKKLVSFNILDIRDFAEDKHKTTDDKPYGGGAGMVMKVEPIYKALKKIKKDKKTRVILLSAKGKTFNQKEAKRLSKYNNLVLICGRYEGVDERVAKNLADEEISIGEYVLTGGELPAMIIADAVTRLIPGVIKEESLLEESHTDLDSTEYPQYTRPEEFMKWKVPQVLLSGDHKKINEWRKKMMKTKKTE